MCPPCGRCHGRHETASHERLEKAFRDYECWEIGSEIPRYSASDGPPGEPSPLERSSGQPDLLRIVRCTIGTPGWETGSSGVSGILRLWKKDGAGGFTFMLSSDALTDGERESLERLCGDLGSDVTVDVRFCRTTPTSERFTT